MKLSTNRRLCRISSAMISLRYFRSAIARSSVGLYAKHPQFPFRAPCIAAPNKQWLLAPWFSPTQPQLRGKERKKAKNSLDLDRADRRIHIPVLTARCQPCLTGNGLLFLLGGTVARVTSLFAPCAPLFASLCAPRAPFLTSFCAPRASFLTPLRTRLRRLSGRRGGRGAGLGSSR